MFAKAGHSPTKPFAGHPGVTRSGVVCVTLSPSTLLYNNSPGASAFIFYPYLFSQWWVAGALCAQSKVHAPEQSITAASPCVVLLGAGFFLLSPLHSSF